MKNTTSTTTSATTSEGGPASRVTAGIHHITAVASEPQRNLDFYVGVLGLKLVKQTVNFDDPSTYHFYFGSEAGQLSGEGAKGRSGKVEQPAAPSSGPAGHLLPQAGEGVGEPGGILTFFPWPNATRGTQGSGAVYATAFGVPMGSLEWWRDRLAAGGVVDVKEFARFGGKGLSFEDHDGMRLELVETGHQTGQLWDPARGEPAISGFHSATLLVRSGEHTKRLLRDQFGMQEAGNEGSRTRFIARGATDVSIGSIVDVMEDPSATPARLGAGVVHHIAMRASDDAQQMAMSQALSKQGFMVTEQRDRTYFRSVYFRERGGVLFEIATDGPGFAIDETAHELGMNLKLPAQYEHARKELAKSLPAIVVRRAREARETGALSAYRHLWNQGESAQSPTVLLLHGTGGSQFDLLEVAQRVAPGAHVLSLLGNVSEQGAARFFRRFAEGVFDLEDVKQRSGQLARFVDAASVRYGFDRAKVYAIGFSNGANIAGAMLLREPGSLAGAVLLRGMTTLAEGLGGGGSARVLVMSGREDPMGTPANAGRLVELLRQAGHRVQHEMLSAGHNLVREDVEGAKRWWTEGDGELGRGR